MKKKIVLATHGNFADGIYHSLEMVFGHQENIVRICAYVDSSKDYQEVMKNCVKSHDYEKENLIVVTDVFGGSVNNEFMQYIMDYPFTLISGLNLPLLLELVMCSEEVVDESLRAIVKNAGSSITICNDLVACGNHMDNNF